MEKQKIWCSDFETVTVNTNYYKQNQDSIVLLACSTNWDEQSSLFLTIQDWFDFHCNLKYSHTIYFHNLSWDGEFILKYLANHTKFRYSNDEVLKDNSYNVFRQGSRIYYIKIFVRRQINGKRYKFFIEIKCSYRLLNCGIEALGKSLGLQKHLASDSDNFYDLEPQDRIDKYPPRFIDYIKNDTLIALRSLKNLEQSILNISIIEKLNKKLLKHRKSGINCFNKLTAASTTKWLMKHFTYSFNYFNRSKEKFLYIPTKDHEEAQKWFHGGFTQINTKYIANPVDINKGIMIDVSSAYPYQMTFPLPYGSLLTKKPDGDYCEFYAIKVKSAKIKKGCEDCVCLYNWDKKKLDTRYQTELKDFMCYYVKEEWEALQNYYDFKVEYMEVYYTKAAPFLRLYAQELYNIKEKYSKAKQDGLKQAAKILLNAGYGCLAMRQDYTNYIYIDKGDFDRLGLGEGVEFDINNRNFMFKRVNDNFNFDKEHLTLIEAKPTKQKQYGVNKLAAAYITAKQRAYLLNKIYEYGPKHFGMCDTDSILIVNVTDDIEKKIKNEVSSGLGSWEIENKENIRYFGTYGAKKYVMLNDDKKPIKIRFAGVSENTSHISKIYEEIDFESDTIEIKDAVFKREFTKNGMVLVKQDKVIKKGTY